MRLRRERALCPFPAFLLASVASGPIISTARPDRKRPVPPYPPPRRPPTFQETTDRTLRALGSRKDRPDNPARIFTKDSSVAGKHTAQKTDHRIPDTKPEKSCAPVRSHDAFRTVPPTADRPAQKEEQISIQKTPVPAFCRPPRRQTGSLPPSRCDARRRRAPETKRRISMTAYRHPAAARPPLRKKSRKGPARCGRRRPDGSGGRKAKSRPPLFSACSDDRNRCDARLGPPSEQALRPAYFESGAAFAPDFPPDVPSAPSCCMRSVRVGNANSRPSSRKEARIAIFMSDMAFKMSPPFSI